MSNSRTFSMNSQTLNAQTPACTMTFKVTFSQRLSLAIQNPLTYVLFVSVVQTLYLEGAGTTPLYLSLDWGS